MLWHRQKGVTTMARRSPKKRADMTPEELEATRAYHREYQRHYRANMTPEQREARRAKAKPYMSAY